ncbi:hypothetical protein Sros01_72270 [Streptomyces roseochromogenus]|nr:hypothetical protein Sros01_72270 [Streptomyces roseochromogenus]
MNEALLKIAEIHVGTLPQTVTALDMDGFYRSPCAAKTDLRLSGAFSPWWEASLLVYRPDAGRGHGGDQG